MTSTPKCAHPSCKDPAKGRVALCHEHLVEIVEPDCHAVPWAGLVEPLASLPPWWARLLTRRSAPEREGPLLALAEARIAVLEATVLALEAMLRSATKPKLPSWAQKREPPTYDEKGVPSPCSVCGRQYCDHPWDEPLVPQRQE